MCGTHFGLAKTHSFHFFNTSNEILLLLANWIDTSAIRTSTERPLDRQPASALRSIFAIKLTKKQQIRKLWHLWPHKFYIEIRQHAWHQKSKNCKYRLFLKHFGTLCEAQQGPLGTAWWTSLKFAASTFLQKCQYCTRRVGKMEMLCFRHMFFCSFSCPLPRPFEAIRAAIIGDTSSGKTQTAFWGRKFVTRLCDQNR